MAYRKKAKTSFFCVKDLSNERLSIVLQGRIKHDVDHHNDSRVKSIDNLYSQDTYLITFISITFWSHFIMKSTIFKLENCLIIYFIRFSLIIDY